MPTPARVSYALNLVSKLGRSLLPGRRTFAIFFAFLLYSQTIIPASLAASAASARPRSEANAGTRPTAPRAPARLTPTAAGNTTTTPATENFGIVLTALDTAFNDHAGLDYHQQSRKILVSSNSPTGQPHNFELIDGAGAHQAFSNINGLGGALKITTARDDGQGASLAGFRKGELFTSTGAAGTIARVSPDGATLQNPWVALPAETGQPAGLHVDRTGIYGGDLLVVTDAGGVWRINPAGTAAQVASLGTPLSGVTTIPDDSARYGPWAGKILVGAKAQGALYAVDAAGNSVSYTLGLSPAEIELVPAHENFFGLDPVGRKLWGAPADAFTSLIGDVLVAESAPGTLARVRWNGTEFETVRIAEVGGWSQIAFAPAGVAEVRGVKQVYDKIAVVRHAPVLNSGRVEGALWQLNAENVSLGGTDVITSDLLVPGSPAVSVGDGHPNFGGVIEGVEDAQPSSYAVSIGANASLRHLITRTNPVELDTVAAPPAPSGTRDASVTKEGESPGDFSSLRDLSLSGRAGTVSVPPGSYGSFSLAGRTTLVLGVENATEPSVYNLQSLTLTGGSELRLAGAVTLTVRNGVTLTGSTIGAADNPRRMLLRVAGGDVRATGNSVLYGVVRAPQSRIEISGRSRLRGTVACDRLLVNGGGVLQVTETDIKPPPVNRPPSVDAGADQSITLPANTVSLAGVVTDDGLPQGSTLTTLWTKTSGAGAVLFADANNATTTATFSEPGLYTLRLRASDSRLTSADEMTVEVVARNQPPTVNAGADQTIKLTDSASLAGTVTDDALPRGATLSLAWSVSGGSPGAVTFGSPHAAATSASFASPGVYTLKLSANDSEFNISDEVVVTVVPSNQPPTVDAGADQTVSQSNPAPTPTEFRLQTISTGFNSPIGIDYHAPTNQVVLSANYSRGGQPHNFELVDADGTHSRFSNISGLTDELKLATARDDGGGMSLGGFSAGELFTGSGAPGVVVRVSPDGQTVQNPWVTLPGENGLMRGSLHIDRTGIYGGDLIVVTTAGGVWRINSAGQPTQLARIPTHLEGVSTIPDIPQKYGPWAGKILIGAEGERRFYTVDARGRIAFFDLGIYPEDIDIIPENENFFGVDFGSGRLWGAPASAFRDMVGDLLVAQEFPGTIFRVRWNGTEFEKTPLATVSQWEHVTFAPAGIVEVAPVGATVTLEGTVTDDNAPGFPLSIAWQKVSGPGAVNFGSPAQPVTTATFSQPGTYVLRLAATDTAFSSSDEVTVVVKPRLLGRVYTRNADFDEGSYINVTHAVTDQLQLDETARTLNFIWVAVSSKGTVVKIDTETGAVLGEYYTSPAGQPRNPSRTTVDQNGNVWATNRDGNSVLHVGLAENGQCVDRNRNGVIDTSKGYGDIRPWTNAGGADTDGGVRTAEDECIIHYTRVNSYGTRHVSVNSDNDVWVSGTGGRNFDLVDGKTGLIKRSEPSVGFGGYGGLIDRNGVIWSARPFLRWDTAKPLTGQNGINWQGYFHDSYGLCIDSKGNVWNTALNGNVIYKFAPDGTQLGAFGHGDYWAQGCVVDKNDDVWVAHSLYVPSVGHVKSSGVFVGNVPVPSGPTGVAVDAKGKIWATNHDTGNVSRIDPNLGPVGADGATRVGAVDFTTQNLGGYLYNYSDMTGSTLTGAPDHGTWSTVFDSQTARSEWGRIGWTARVCGDGLLAVSVAASEDGTTFGQPVVVANGDDPEVAAGRYLKVTVRFERASSGESPVLYDLSVGTNGFALATPANAAPDLDAGADQTLNGVLKTTLRATACDDSLPSNRKLDIAWSKVSGAGTVSFARPGSLATEVTFGAVGTYELKLTVSDSTSTKTDTISVEVVPGNEPPNVNAGADQSVTHPNTATLVGSVTDDGLPRGSTLLFTWSKLSGPGGVTFAAPDALSTSARFGAPGTYVLRLTASDTEFARHDELTVNVNGTNQPPTVNAGADQTITLPQTAALGGTATDDGWPENSPLAVSWSVVSGAGAVVFGNPNSAATVASFSTEGTYVLRLTASDSELTTSDDVIVVAGAPVPLPVVSIKSPADGSRLSDRTQISGSVSGGSWRLEYSLNSSSGEAERVWTTFASGDAPVEGLLGTFDPTLLLNGSYRVRLLATNAAGQTSEANFSAVVNGELKVGLFTVSFVDLSVPVAGIPVEVSRTYDSRDKRVGDFGVGWSLGLKNVRVEKSAPLGGDWTQTSSGGLLPTYCLRPTTPTTVTITFPSGRVYDFATNVVPQCQAFVPVQYASVGFTQLPGDADTQGATLTALDYGNSVFFTGAAPGTGELLSDETIDLYDPHRFRLTTSDGVSYDVDESGGLQSVRDRNGNTLSVSASGIIHSSGKSISFTRDAENRITRITDPAGNHLDYNYDANGDLTTATDQTGRATRFTYNSSHGLLDIVDPLNRHGVRNEYDAGGRLVSITDDAGKTVRFEFDPDSRQQIVTDRKGNITVYEYDEQGYALSITDANGKVVRSTYDRAGNRLTHTDQFGATTTFTYDARGNVLTRTDAQNRVTRYTYNERNEMTSVTDANGNKTTAAYDANGNLTAATDALGNTTAFTYDAAGNVLTATDAANHAASFEYDAFGNMTKATDRLGRVTRFTYNALGARLSLIDPKGNTTQFNYDAAGRPTTTVDALGHTTRNEFDPVGNLSASVDALGRRTEITNNFRGQPLEATNPDGTQLSLRYDANGDLEGSSATGGLAPTLERDKVNLPTKIMLAPGVSLGYEYDAAGRKTAESDPLGNTSTYQYNLLDKVTLHTDALGKQTHLGYDAVGNLVSQTDPNGNTTTFTYDKTNRPVRRTLPDGAYYESTYDALGQIVAARDPLGNTTAFAYDDEGNLLTVTQPGGAVTRYEYDANGNLVSATDANGRKTLFEYNKLNLLVKKTFPDRTTELTAYNEINMVSSQTDRKGDTTAFEYDQMARLSLVRHADGATVAYTYTPTGKRDTVTDARGVMDYDYDALERVRQVRFPGGTTVAYTYDLAGNRTSITTPDGTTLYGYDKGNRLVKVTDPRGLVTSYAYDAAGNVVGVSYPNGVTTAKTYDGANQLMSIRTTNRNGATILHETYTRDAGGRRTKVVEADGSSVEYAYDAQSRLTGEIYKDAGGVVRRQTGYTYDAVGNRLTKTDAGTNTTVTYTYNVNDQLTSDGGRSYAYDADGKLISKTVFGSATSYAYDSRKRLARVTRPDGSAVSYAYDAAGNRVSSTDASGHVINYVVDVTAAAPKVVVEMDADGQEVAASYTYGLELISQRRGGADSFYHQDALGSTKVLTDVNGAVVDSYSYDAFGQLTAGGAAASNSFRYAGEQNDADTELYYLRARYYDPSVGRFLSTDPYEGNLEDPATRHRYTYTQNNPVNATDPTGMMTAVGGTAIHGVIGRFYIAIWGDYFVDVLNLNPNRAKLFHLITIKSGNGKAAYNRAIRTGKRGEGRPDLRNYETGDVYEIKPYNAYGLSSGPKEARDYTNDLNAETGEKGAAEYGDWHLGYMSFSPWTPFPYDGGLVEAYSWPLAPAGTILYTYKKEEKPRNQFVDSLVTTAVYTGGLVASGFGIKSVITASVAEGGSVLAAEATLAAGVEVIAVSEVVEIGTIMAGIGLAAANSTRTGGVLQ